MNVNDSKIGDNHYKADMTMPLTSMFLGPHAENHREWKEAFDIIFSDYVHWRKNYYSQDGYILEPDNIERNKAFYNSFFIKLESLLNDLKQGFPFHSPRYMGHMLSEQSLPSVMGYYATMLYNPNNVTEEAAPVTVSKEIDFGKRICKMLGYTSNGWAHLCSGGSAANLEALWAARQSQFMPLIIKDLCEKKQWDFKIKLPNYSVTGQMISIRECSYRELLHIKPDESLYMLSNLTDYLQKNHEMTKKEVISLFRMFAVQSEYNVRTNGYGNVISKLHLKPIVFIPQSAHYSLKKAVNILGYGEASVRYIPLTDKFRINVDALEEMIINIKENEYIAAVVVVFGSTEEGAIDPVHRVKWMRDFTSSNKGLSFWLHVDAAWGGYFSVMKNQKDDNSSKLIDADQRDFWGIIDDYIHTIDVSEEYVISFEKYVKKKKANWNDREVYAAMFALSAADSITVDPHKMGYVPYPAGVIAFKNKRIVYLLQEHATYIGTDSEFFQHSDLNDEDTFESNFYQRSNNFAIPQIGAYTLEGSRPGAAAMACWFASDVIPLDLHNHGKIIRTTLLNARRFAQYLQQHRRASFQYIDELLQRKEGIQPCGTPFSIELLYNNIDTNIVCFFVRPAKWRNTNETIKQPNDKIDDDLEWTLSDINTINNNIYKMLTISPSNERDSRKTSLYQKFYVAHTTFENSKYSYGAMQKVLERFNFSKEDYIANGLMTMRCTIMNPWYYQALSSSEHTDYFMQFLEEIHLAARKVIDSYQRAKPKCDDSE